MPRTPSPRTSWTWSEIAVPPSQEPEPLDTRFQTGPAYGTSFQFTTEQLERIERLSQQFRASEQATIRALTGRTWRNQPIQIQNIPASSLTVRGNFFGVDRSAQREQQPDRLRGARYDAAWVDDPTAWVREYLGDGAQVTVTRKNRTADLAKEGLAKLDAEEAELAKKTAHLGVHDPEPVVTSIFPLWYPDDTTGRFRTCSCDDCAQGRAWNEWADRTGVPHDDTVVDPRIRQGVISAD
jgi:hypothetical protein